MAFFGYSEPERRGETCQNVMKSGKLRQQGFIGGKKLEY